MPFRLRAFLVHFAISLTVTMCTLILVFQVWHPGPLAKAVGVTHIFLLLLAIDATLGPVLTLIVAKEGKKSLKMDLTIIAALQISAFCYGMYHIAQARPVWIAFDTVRFELVASNAVDKSSRDVQAEYRYSSWLDPEWVAVRPPANDQEKSRRLFYELEQGFSPASRPALYEPLANAWQIMERAAHSLAELEQYNSKDTVEQISAKYPQANGYLPLLAPEVDMAVLINTKEQEVIKIVDLRPWE